MKEEPDAKVRDGENIPLVYWSNRLRRYIAYPDVGVSAGEGLLAGSS